MQNYCRHNSAINCVYLCRHYFDYAEFKREFDLTKDIDAIIIDIRLDNEVNFDADIPVNKDKRKFHEEAGFYIFNDLLRLGYPVEKICFMTGEKNSLHGFQYKCLAIYIQDVIGFEKSDTGYGKLRQWIKERNTYYCNLRRGVVDGCRHAKPLIKNSLYFNSYTSGNDASHDDLTNYFDVLESYLPLRQPDDKKTLYKLFIRTLSHEWESAKNIKPDPDKKPDAMLAWIMRNTRHWVTHNSSLFSDTDEQLLAFLFIVNLRVMFNFDDFSVQNYENILLRLFDNEALDESEFSQKYRPISDVYLELRNFILDENKLLPKGQKIEETFYFNHMANNIQMSKSQKRVDKKLFAKLLYQMFWLMLCHAFVDKKNKNSLEIKFWNFDFSDKPYLFELARHIYHRSFPQT